MAVLPHDAGGASDRRAADGGTARPGRAGRRELAYRSLLAGLLLLSAATACGGGATRPAAGPGRLERVSPSPDSARVGEAVQPGPAVRVVSVTGRPVADVAVDFEVERGSGEVEPSVASTGPEGVARVGFTAGDQVGGAVIRASLADRPGVGSVRFSVVVLPPRRTLIRAADGDGQEAEVGSQLPRPFVATVTTRDSVPVGGVPVTWRVTGAAGAGARLTADTALTGPGGRVETLLSLGDSPGAYRVSARSAGAEEGAEFAATAVEGVAGTIRIDSVLPRPLRAGEEARIFGAGYAETAADNEVRVEGREAEVLAASGTRLRVQVPAFEGRCLPARSAGVRVLVGGEKSGGPAVPLRPARPFLDLEVGETRALSAAENGSCAQLAAADDAREYRIAVQSASTASGAVTPLRLVGRTGPGWSAAAARPSGAGGKGGGGSAVRAGPDGWGALVRTRVRRRAREEVGRLEARAAPPVEREVFGRKEARAAAADGGVGDTARFTLPVGKDLAVSCTDTSVTVTAVARASGEHLVLYEDVSSPDPGFGAAEWAQIREELGGGVYPVDTAYFGSPADIDGNGRVILLFTPEVNALTPGGTEALVGGFFLPTDLADSGDAAGSGTAAGGVCPASNEAEILYLAVPDPDGEAGPPVSRGRALRNARGVTAHQLEHLLSAEQRVFRADSRSDASPFEALESMWLGEGMAHVAEEAAGLAFIGRSERQNLGFDAVTADPVAFRAFFLPNYRRARRYLRRPASTATLAGRDPGGIESLRTRGFAWLFARWLGDRAGPEGSDGPLSGSDEQRLFRELSSGGPEGLRGVENVERAVATVSEVPSEWSALLADFGLAVTADDDVPGVPRANRFLTWDLRDVYRGLHESSRFGAFEREYPLSEARAGFESLLFDFDVGASSAAYFTLSAAGASPALSLQLVAADGGTVPPAAEPRVLILRAR